MKSIRTCLCLLAVAAVAVPAQANWFDGFESYALGNLPPQGGWTDFGGTQPIVVSNTQAHSGTQSMRLSEGTGVVGGSGGYGSDVYLNIPGSVFNSGQHTLSYWQYVDPGVDSVSFMYISTGSMPNNFQTGLDLRMDLPNFYGFGSSLLIVQDIGGQPTLVANPVPAVTGRWVEHRMDVDLTANLYNYTFDGVTRVSNAQWDTTPGDGVNLGGINFWMQLGNTDGVNRFVYFDDFSLVTIPEPTIGLLMVLVGVACSALRRRTG